MRLLGRWLASAVVVAGGRGSCDGEYLRRSGPACRSGEPPPEQVLDLQWKGSSMRRFTLLIVGVLCFARVAAAGPVDDARNAFLGRDYATAYSLFKSSAEQGNPEAQFYLGIMYERGWGTATNAEVAAAWYRKAADQGHDRAQYNLGVFYERGRGLPVDLKLAEYWYLRSANQNNWRAMSNVAELYEAGSGLPQDYVQAYMWLSLAVGRRPAAQAGGGDTVNAIAIATPEEERLDDLRNKMTQEQLRKATELARNWTPKIEK